MNFTLENHFGGMMDSSLPIESRQKEIFLELVKRQDEGLTVHDSRAVVAQSYGVTLETIKAIERHGIDQEWPPLA